jgi:GNAT superfamily N-acetyltransferase
VLRDATADDDLAIATVHVEARSAGYARFLEADSNPSLTLEGSLAHWRELLARTDRRTVVAEVDGEVLGFAHFGLPPDAPKPSEQAGILGFIYVLPQHWGTDVAVSLLAAAEEGLAAEGFTTAYLGVNEENRRARAFYERHGWTHDGERWQIDRGRQTQVRYVKPLRAT